jgi:FkbM family methyltransferase
MSGLLRRMNYLPVWRNYLPVWGKKMFHPSGDRWLYLMLHRMGLMGSLERKTIQHILRPGMSVLDVGGNIGLYTILFSQLVGEKGRVVTIEPIPELHESLSKNIENNLIKNVTILPFAAGAQAGFVRMNLDALNSGNNWISAASTANSGVEVPVQRLDALNWEPPFDFVKIDVQGWETQVLKGMSGVIPSRCRPIIMCEIAEASLKAAGSSARDLGQLLLGYRYDVYMPRRKGDEIEMEILNLPGLEEKAARASYFDIIALPSSA